jgi:hypothetical protein
MTIDQQWLNTATCDEIKARLATMTPEGDTLDMVKLSSWVTFAGGIETHNKQYPLRKKDKALQRAESLTHWRKFYISNHLGPARKVTAFVLAPRLGMCSQNVNKILQIARLPHAVKATVSGSYVEHDGDKLLELARIKDHGEKLAKAEEYVNAGKPARKPPQPKAEPVQQTLPHLNLPPTPPPALPGARIRDDVPVVELTVGQLRQLIREELEGDVMVTAVAAPRVPPIAVQPTEKVIPIRKTQHVYRSLAYWNKQKSGDCKKEDQLPAGCRYWHTVGKKLGIYPPPNPIWGHRHVEVNKVTGKTETSWHLSKRFYDVSKKYVGHYWATNQRLLRSGLSPTTAHRKASDEALTVLGLDIKSGALKVLRSELDRS